MKKLSLILAFAALSFSASAQTLNVQSAIQDLKKNYLKKAKAEIDLATEHEQTKDDAKTWLYRGLIYSSIGRDVATNAKSKVKGLAPDWAEQAYAAALECKRLDTKNEYANENNSVFTFVGGEFYSRSIEAFNTQNYQEAREYAEKAVEMYNNGDPKSAVEPMYIAGRCYKALKDNEGVKKCFNSLIRKKTDKKDVYRILFDIYKEEGNNDAAMKTASSYKKNCPNDYNADLLMAEGYLLNQNIEKGKEMLEEALQKTKNDAALYPQLLCQVGALLEITQDYSGAEAKFSEAMQLDPNLFAANFGMGSMIYNRAVEKHNAANEVPETDESGLYEKLLGESNDLFRQSIQYLQAGINIIDAMPADAQPMQRANLFNCLKALKVVYARLEMYDELKGINERMTAIQNAAQ